MRFLRYTLWGLVGVALIVIAGHQLSHNEEEESQANTSFRPSFSLTNHFGQAVTEETYRGKWLLAFFGFTNCPDICPTTLADLVRVMDELGPEAKRVTPLFVSIDPERDRVENMAEYVKAFHPKIVGLTGSNDNISNAAKSFKVFFERLPQESAPAGYTMGHTSAVYLISDDGYFVRTYQYGTPSSEIVEDIKERI